MNPNDIYKIIAERCSEMDTIPDEYIVHLVGIIGLNVLIENKLIECCGVRRGDNVYILCGGKVDD